jgi:hypothetical protein
MASHGVSWTLGAHVHFGSLDFLITTDRMLARASAPVQPMRSVKIDAIIKDLEELQLRAPRGDQLLNSNYG